MRSFEPVRFGLIGSGWITRQHHAAFLAIPREASVVACADYPRDRGGRPGRGEAMAGELGIPRYFGDYRRMLEDRSIEAVTVALPNSLHAEVTLAALEAGKHVVVEKPLCFSLADADAIIRLAREKSLIVGYAEELCYCPKLVRGKQLVERGGIGKLFYLTQVETHSGPYSPWFFDPPLAGGGALIDMGCHSIEWARWMLDKKPVARVTAKMSSYVHGGPLDDHCVIHLEWAGGETALLEAGWTLKGGMDSVAHLRGTEGRLDLDLLNRNGIELFSTTGVAGEDTPPGWSTPSFDWLHQNGYPQEMADFARAIRTGERPLESAEDGRATLEIIWAAYASALEGRTIDLPYAPPADARFPAERWMSR